MDEETLRAYVSARVWIELPGGGMVVSPRPPGERAGGFPLPESAVVHIISPVPPRNVTIDLPHGTSGLRSYIRELGLAPQMLESVGADPAGEYHEWSIATIGLRDEEALAIGRAYRQDAIFRWSSIAWALVECETECIHSLGWRVTPAERWQEIGERGL